MVNGMYQIASGFFGFWGSYTSFFVIVIIFLLANFYRGDLNAPQGVLVQLRSP